MIDVSLHLTSSDRRISRGINLYSIVYISVMTCDKTILNFKCIEESLDCVGVQPSSIRISGFNTPYNGYCLFDLLRAYPNSSIHSDRSFKGKPSSKKG